MGEAADPTTAALDATLARHRAGSLLRLITCGSVDDGKSTLIGRLLYDSRLVLEDQLATLERDSRRSGTQNGGLDFALLVDGLAAEREQGITIDVAYRFFATERRKFIIADTPGHEQYTRNMVTGASTAALAIILVDARTGVLTQTRRHSFLVELLGIRSVVLAVNKMDLVDWREDRFDAIRDEYAAFARAIGLTDIAAIPISALNGDNVVAPGTHAPWYRGPTVLAHLEQVEPAAPTHPDATPTDTAPFRMPVQLALRPNEAFRGVAGLITAGSVRPGDAVRVLPSGRQTTVAAVRLGDTVLDRAGAGRSVTLVLADAVDVSRGDVLTAADQPVEIADQFAATIVWMGDEPLLPGRSYLFKLGPRIVPCQVTAIRHRVNVNTLEHVAARTLDGNDIGACHLALDEPVAFAPYNTDRDLGGAILIDRLTQATVGAVILEFALRRSHNIHWQALAVTRENRAALKHQRPAVLWFTGLSGAGKSTIASRLEARLHAAGRHTAVLDGDNIRHGLNRDLGFTDADRVENIRRVAEVARLMADAGLIVLVSFISPFRAERALARSLLPPGEFIEVHVATPLAVAEARDPKGLYRKARAGTLRNFTGIDSDYEPPEAPEITLDTTDTTPADNAERVFDYLRAALVLGD